MADGTIDEILAAAMKPIPEGTWFRAAMEKAFAIVDRAEGNFLNAWMPLHDELWCSYKATVSEAVAEAFGVLKLVNGDFRTGVVAAGNFGRDADTIGAHCRLHFGREVRRVHHSSPLGGEAPLSHRHLPDLRQGRGYAGGGRRPVQTDSGINQRLERSSPCRPA